MNPILQWELLTCTQTVKLPVKKDTRRNGQPPKSQLAKKVNSLKTPNISFWLFYAQVDFLAS